MLMVTTVGGWLVTKDGTFREGRQIKLVNGVVFFYTVVISFILSSPSLFVFGDDHVTCYTGVKDVASGVVEE